MNTTDLDLLIRDHLAIRAPWWRRVLCFFLLGHAPGRVVFHVDVFAQRIMPIAICRACGRSSDAFGNRRSAAETAVLIAGAFDTADQAAAALQRRRFGLTGKGGKVVIVRGTRKHDR